MAAAVRVADAAWAGPLVRVGGAAAGLGALLALVAGVGRTTLAMAREGDLPRFLDGVHPRHHVPHRAEIAVAAVVGVLVLTTDLRGVIGFSSFGVLLYYAVANASALTQERRPALAEALQVLGLVGCLVLVGDAALAGRRRRPRGLRRRHRRLASSAPPDPPACWARCAGRHLVEGL